MKNKTVPILYHGGTYGTYLHWVLDSLTTDANVCPPFNTNGNSHLFNGKHTLDLNGWRDYVNSDGLLPFVRFHPKTGKDQRVVDTFREVLTDADKLIYIYVDQQSKLLCIANFFNKVWDDWWNTCEFNVNDLLTGWNIDPSTPLDHIPRWVRREFLSYHLFSMWDAMNDYHDQELLTHPNVIVVSVTDLLANFSQTVEVLVSKSGILPVKPISDLVPYHKQMLDLQHNLNIQEVCNNIVNSMLTNSDLIWANNFILEVAIQHNLRELGYEIRCDGLDIFPTDSVSLRKLLYRP